jgi:hypothetical protein
MTTVPEGPDCARIENFVTFEMPEMREMPEMFLFSEIQAKFGGEEVVVVETPKTGVVERIGEEMDPISFLKKKSPLKNLN